MTKKGRGNGGSEKGGEGSRGGGGKPTVRWVNPKPNNADIEWLEGQADDYIEQITFLVDELSDEQRLSVKHDGYSGRWLAILFDDTGSEDGVIHALSVRGSTAFASLVLLHYYHHIKFKGDWHDYRDADSGMFG